MTERALLCSLQSSAIFSGDAQACQPAEEACTTILQTRLPTAADLRSGSHPCLPPDAERSGTAWQDSQPTNDDIWQLSDLPESRDLGDLLLDDLPGFNLDLDSMIGELEAMEPSSEEQQCPSSDKLGRSQSHGSEQVYSMDSQRSSNSLLQLRFREGSPSACSSQPGQEVCDERPSSSGDAPPKALSRRTAISKRRKGQEDNEGIHITKR